MKDIRLVEGPPIAGHHAQHCDELHLLVLDGSIVPCTPSEYALLLQVLGADSYVPLATLAVKVLQSTLTRSTRRSLTQHISRVRAKLWPFGLDIRCIAGCGYLSVPFPPEAPPQQ